MAKKKKQEHIQAPEQTARMMDVKRQQALTREKLYPALVDATVSIDESKMLLQAINSLIMEESLQVLREKKVQEIKDKLVKKLCEEGREKEITALLETISGETLFTAKSLIEGLTTAIDYTLRAESMNRTLNSLEPDWDTMMTK